MRRARWDDAGVNGDTLAVLCALDDAGLLLVALARYQLLSAFIPRARRARRAVEWSGLDLAVCGRVGVDWVVVSDFFVDVAREILAP